MTTLVASKMTEAEADILDWLVQQGMFSSRSDAIRHAIKIEAQRRGLTPGELRRAVAEREQLRERVAPKQKQQRAKREAERPHYGKRR